MRSLVRYSLIALGLVALAVTVAVFRPRLEQKAMAQIPTGCDPGAAPNKTTNTKCVVISSFRENGPAGTGDEYIEIFNASTVAATVSNMSNDPSQTPCAGPACGIGVFASTGNGCATNIGGGCSGAANAANLVCQIPGSVVIPGRGYFLCAGTAYSLNTLGANSGPTTHSQCLAADVAAGDCQFIGGGNAAPNSNIPDDAGLALLDIGTQIVTACSPFGPGVPGCETGFAFSAVSVGGNAIIYDKVGFNPYGGGAPAAGRPTFADNYCEGRCLAPIGDASVTTAGQLGGTCPPGGVSQAGATFPVLQQGTVRIPQNAGGTDTGVARCYGESGQYKIERRRAASSFINNQGAGDIHRDTQNNDDDFILLAPNPASTNIGQAITGRGGVLSVLGAAGPHNRRAPRVVGQGIYTGTPFDSGGNQLAAGNAERRYAIDSHILNRNNDPQGTFLLRIKFTNSGNAAVSGVRFRIDDISGMCGGQAGLFTTGSGAGSPHVAPPTDLVGKDSRSATQEARNLRLPTISGGTTPLADCGEGDPQGLFTAVLKGVNHNAEFVAQPSNQQIFFVNGSVLEDVVPSAGPTPVSQAAIAGPTPLSPLGGGGDNSYVINSNMQPTAVGDGVSGGPGSFAVAQGNSGSTSVLRVAFKFGVVKAGRFKLLLGREAAGPTPVN